MLSTIIVIAICLLIIESFIAEDSNHELVMLDVLTEARKRYIEAYALDTTAGDVGIIFDKVIKRSRFVDGTFKFNDDYTFKQVLVSAGTSSNFYDISRAEAFFVYDFVMEGYRNVIGQYDKVSFDCNLNTFKEYV